ncbi:MAG: AAA family ATPase [Saprospiraceae bacterium]|nr:AAA family ATPase [Saprospiraceae bacterium]
MIRIESIIIEEFRGIRSLEIDFKKENYVICGPNGTGKSGIVDAIDFALTGNISRLSGRGMGNVSLKEHAPHVDSRNNPDKARVILKVFIESLEKEVLITRTVKDAIKPKLTPDTKDVVDIINNVSIHPEFVLSRRELIKYILSTPGDRSKEVQTLLRLDDLETIRGIFQKISNAKNREIIPLKQLAQNAKEELQNALGTTSLTTQTILEAVNIQRTILSLPPLLNLSATASLRDGLSTSLSSKVNKIPKTQALLELDEAERALVKLWGFDPLYLKNARERISSLLVNEDFLKSASRAKFLETSLSLIEADACPLCDKEWNIDALRDLINSKLKKYEELNLNRKASEHELMPITSSIQQLKDSLFAIQRYGALLEQPIEAASINQYTKELNSFILQINSFLPLKNTLQVLTDIIEINSSVKSTLESLKTAIQAIPEPTAQDAARDYLTLAQERYEKLGKAIAQVKKVEAQSKLTTEISESFTTKSNEILEGVYSSVEGDFSNLYREINKDDEIGFSAKLKPSAGKLGFDVDFYGRGFFPPGAYHSEGHQDGMGICLYLALMNHLLGKSFSLAVLDDVLMSVDSGHRREVCSMLKKNFPNTQFIFTTHDEIWLEHMKGTGLINRNSAIQFRTWDVDQGPTKWDDRDIWQQIKDEAVENNIRSSSALLRHYLEHISAELCHYLGAPVKYRADARYELGELLPSAISRLRKLLKQGKAVAQSWANKDEVERIQKIEDNLTQLMEKAYVDKWMINAAVHYNEWANFKKNDFLPLIESYENLLREFYCNNCGSAYFINDNINEQELRCSCNKNPINLIPKK